MSSILNHSIADYWKRVYDARYFWIHLARMDLKNRFRRSKLGILWVCVNPLCLMLIMSAVFGVVFRQDVVSLMPYILSGLLFWSIITDAFIAGWSTIVGNEPYIRQFNHPVIIYPLKSAVSCIISFSISTLSLGVITLFSNPQNILLGYATLPVTIIIFFIFEWSGMIVAAYIGTKYRDYPQLASLFFQAVWYLSPVFFQESMFEQNEYLYALFTWNPITHMLKLIRKPFLDGQLPSLTNYAVSILITCVVAFCAYCLNRKNSKDIIFYL